MPSKALDNGVGRVLLVMGIRADDPRNPVIGEGVTR